MDATGDAESRGIHGQVGISNLPAFSLQHYRQSPHTPPAISPHYRLIWRTIWRATTTNPKQPDKPRHHGGPPSPRPPPLRQPPRKCRRSQPSIIWPWWSHGRSKLWPIIIAVVVAVVVIIASTVHPSAFGRYGPWISRRHQPRWLPQ